MQQSPDTPLGIAGIESDSDAVARYVNQTGGRREEAFPAVPTLLATRLQLDLLLRTHGHGSIDLRAATSILLNDLGATVELFRRAGEECFPGQAAPTRVEDCLASLSTDSWIEIVSAQPVERTPAGPALTAFWEHGRLLAYACWLVAERTEGFCPEEAYLVGLLHEAARLPELLGWHAGGPPCCDSVSALVAHWHLPLDLRSLLACPSAPSRWTRLLATAHAWARGEDCLLLYSA